MTHTDILPIVRYAPVLSPDDSLRRAAGLIRASDGSVIFVSENGGISGAVTEQSIAAYLAAAPDAEAALGDPLKNAITQRPESIPSRASVQQAAAVFGGTDTDTLPVVDEYGTFRGVIYRHDVVGLLSRSLRPPTVGGMATPLGVYLTSGHHTGGAGNLGLFLTGATLALLILTAAVVAFGIMMLIGAATGIPLHRYLYSVPLTLSANIYDLPLYVYTALSAGLMLLMLRLSPLSGYHAAEHMTVHAIEAGEAITPEVVRQMPRVHGRCGTNLMAAAGIFLLIAVNLNGGAAVIVALVVVIAGWRSVGGVLQSLVTTKNPSRRQLDSGVSAGRQLIERFQEQPNLQLRGFERVWRMGLLQTGAGMLVTWQAALWVLEALNVQLPLMW